MLNRSRYGLCAIIRCSTSNEKLTMWLHIGRSRGYISSAGRSLLRMADIWNRSSCAYIYWIEGEHGTLSYYGLGEEIIGLEVSRRDTIGIKHEYASSHTSLIALVVLAHMAPRPCMILASATSSCTSISDIESSMRWYGLIRPVERSRLQHSAGNYLCS